MKQSAGILVYRLMNGKAEVLLAHPGGPIWGHRDFWTIPKGELDPGENHLEAAFREFEEEIGMKPPESDLTDLGSSTQSSGKTNSIWATEGNIDLSGFSCNNFTMEWPPKSGKLQEFPENDRAEWFDLSTAKQKLFKAQTIFINRLAEHLQVQVLGTNKQ